MTELNIFLAALDIPELAERSAYVESACAGNATLRRQVEALLAAHDRSGLFLDEPAIDQWGGHREATDGVDVPTGPDSPTLTGSDTAAAGGNDLEFLQPSTRPGSRGRLAHYEVLEVLGRGGFGTVLRAFDDRLHRVVAIKILAPQLATSGTARARFNREARAAAAIRDEHVVGIHAVSEENVPVPYLVMEFISGQTLQQKIDRTGPLSIAAILRIGSQIAKGLAAAHATGLIHRDVKPSNILLENGVERVKLTDFGLARAADDASISHSGVVAGTPMYMSPEQAHGGKIDPRADLFSLGSVLYAMCTGRPPFRAATTMAVLKRVCEEDPRPVREINPEVPEWLAAVIARLHARNPADRFQSAREVADLLVKYQSDMQHLGYVPDAIVTGPARPQSPPRIPDRSPGATIRQIALLTFVIAAFPWAVYLGERLLPGALFFFLAGGWLLGLALLYVLVHRRLRTVTSSPELIRRKRLFGIVCASIALVGSMTFVIVGFAWREYSVRQGNGSLAGNTSLPSTGANPSAVILFPAAVVIALLAAWWSVRRLRRIARPAATADPVQPRSGRTGPVGLGFVTLVSLGVFAGLVILSLSTINRSIRLNLGATELGLGAGVVVVLGATWILRRYRRGAPSAETAPAGRRRWAPGAAAFVLPFLVVVGIGILAYKTIGNPHLSLVNDAELDIEVVDLERNQVVLRSQPGLSNTVGEVRPGPYIVRAFARTGPDAGQEVYVEEFTLVPRQHRRIEIPGMGLMQIELADPATTVTVKSLRGSRWQTIANDSWARQVNSDTGQTVLAREVLKGTYEITAAVGDSVFYRTYVDVKSREVRVPVRAPNSRPVRLRSFIPGQDAMPLPLRGPASAVTVVGDAWRIENSNQGGNFNVMIVQAVDRLPTDGILVFRAKVRVEAKDNRSWGDLGFGAANHLFISWDGWPRVRSRYDGSDSEWTEKEERFPAADVHKKGPTVYLYAGLHADGVLWLKDAELLHVPAEFPGKQ